MPNRIPIPLPGETSACEPWQLYMLRPPCDWKPVGAFGSRRIGEMQINSMRQLLPGRQFRLVWEGQRDAA